ncbi:hypothetical protein DPV78_005628 [Talaromyces pinophilus]|nr:hypothetical protein DPV78_005628 [Talaromyces pinophilus]
MSSNLNEFQDLQSFIYGSDQPIDGSQETEVGSCGRDNMSYFANFLEEQRVGQVPSTMEGMQESDGLFVDPLRTINQNGLRDLSSMPTIINTYGGLGHPSYPYDFALSSNENPYQTGPEFARLRPPLEPMTFWTGFQESSVQQLNLYQSGMQVAEQTPIVEPNDSNNIHSQPPKREASATISRRLSEITPDGGNVNNSKRKRSDDDVEADGEDASRSRYARRILNENTRYRNELKLSRPEPARPRGVRRLFENLKNDIIPKSAYYRKKGANAAASQQPIPSTASTALPGTVDEASSSTPNRRSRQANSRRHIPVETVRQTAPVGWDRFDNEYYSGDDNVSDGGIEARGKATDWKPPRMACRRCNKFKQPCDHAYPACSRCAKYGLRCRYRDDLTGRQIRPGQLEEMEVALHDAQAEIKRLQEKVKRLEDAQNPRDDAED